MPLEFAKLTSRQIRDLDPARTVFFFAVGPLEDHGPQLPVGLDLMQAVQLCFSSGQRLERELPDWRGVLMPAAALGVESNTQKIALTVRAYVLRDWLVDSCRALDKQGFRHFVCFSGHPGPKQLTAIEDAGKIVSRFGFLRSRAKKCALVSASSALVKATDLKHSLLFPNPPEHGGGADASWGLFMKQVPDAGALAELPRKDASSPGAGGVLGKTIERVTGQVEGYWGDPSQASPGLGQQLLGEQLDLVFPKLRAVWEGSNPNALFRSWYSILFFNKSFFKAWLIAGMIFAVLIAWYFISFGN